MENNNNSPNEQTEFCPKCAAELVFRETDNGVEYFDCPNCGKINLKKEKWKKQFQELPDYEPSIFDKIKLNCRLCKHHRLDSCKLEEEFKTCFELNTQVSDSDKLLILVNAMDKTFYKDQYNFYYLWINDDGTFKSFKLDSEPFKLFLNKIFFKTLGKSLNREKLKDAILSFKTFASLGPTINIKARVQKVDETIFVDVCNEQWQSIKITSEGYTIENKTEPLFKRFRHMKPLPLPKSDGVDCDDDASPSLLPLSYITELRAHENKEGSKSVAEKQSQSSTPSHFPYLMFLNSFIHLNEDDFFLTLCHLLNTFFVDSPQTTISINGEKGSGKSFVSETLKKIVDPSSTLTVDLPKKTDEMLQILDHHHYPCFDNVSYISHEVSDIFCRANTGSGNSKRQLYTDDTEFIRNFKKSININGINVAVVREDLLDRTILVNALSFNYDRKTEKQLEEEFNRVFPFILHDLYTLVSKVLSLLPGIEAPKQFRMIDFGKIGCAVAKALGHSENFFIKTYSDKLNSQILEAIYNHTLGNILLDFMEDKTEYKNSSKSLYKELKVYAKDELGISANRKGFPKAANLMSKQLNELKEAFSKIGIDLIYHRTGVARTWTIINNNFKTIDIQDCDQSQRTLFDGFVCNDCGKKIGHHEVFTGNDQKKRCSECNMGFLLNKGSSH